MTHFKLWYVFLVLLIAAPAMPASAQEDDACPTLVEAALEAVGDACGGLGRGEACYGHTRVDATFWEARDELAFGAPADVAPLLDLQQVATAPLDLESEQWGIAVFNVQPGSPALAPGQAVTFLLMGDATLENEVSPDDRPPVTPVTATTNTRSNLRSRPTTASNVVETVDADTELALVGVNTAGDWYETADAAWIWGELVAADDPDALAALPATDAEPRYGPMQAFYFSTGLGAPTCEEAPNALVVQSPEDVEVVFTINGMEVALGSTVVFTMAEVTPEGETEPARALVTTLVDGSVSATVEKETVFELTAPGEAAAVTLNDEERIDAESEVVPPPVDEVAPAMENACNGAVQTGLFAPAACDAEVAAYEPPSTAGETPAVESVEGVDETAVEAGGACIATATSDINLRNGPGANYLIVGTQWTDQSIEVDGQAADVGGQMWWRLTNGMWVRSDLVETEGACTNVSVVVSPPPPSAACGVLINFRGGFNPSGPGGGHIRSITVYLVPGQVVTVNVTISIRMWRGIGIKVVGPDGVIFDEESIKTQGGAPTMTRTFDVTTEGPYYIEGSFGGGPDIDGTIYAEATCP